MLNAIVTEVVGQHLAHTRGVRPLRYAVPSPSPLSSEVSLCK